MATRVVMDPAKLADLLRGPSGPVMRRLIEDGEAVKGEARRLVRVHKMLPNERRKRRPGTLRDSIVSRVRGQGVVEVGSEDPIALIEHEGSKSHLIRARNAPMLVFVWPKQPMFKFVRFKQVTHPGAIGSKYLVNALRVLRSRY